MQALHVKTPVFEGPLHILLELIEKRKLLINDVSLAAVTDEYIARINNLPEIPVGETADFIALAATLLLIKSRSLLPSLILSDDESRDIKELEYRLALYQLIKDGASALAIQQKGPSLYGGHVAEREPLFVFDPTITLASLRASAGGLIDGFPKLAQLPQVAVRKIVSIEETIERLSKRVSSAFTLSFKEFSGLGAAASSEARYSVIISFLALLELVKQGTIKANQSEHFSDITLEADSVSTPSYE